MRTIFRTIKAIFIELPIYGYLVLADVVTNKRTNHWAFENPDKLALLVEYVRKEFQGSSFITNVMSSYGPVVGYRTYENSRLYWDAPIGISLWSRGDVCLGLGLQINGRHIYVRQLQGVPNIRLPRDLYMWPRKLIRACVAYARAEGFTCVRVYRATECPYYDYPHIGSDEEDYEEDKAALQARLRKRYDETARSLGFRMKSRYGELKLRKRATR